jgi:hypothetical protein
MGKGSVEDHGASSTSASERRVAAAAVVVVVVVVVAAVLEVVVVAAVAAPTITVMEALEAVILLMLKEVANCYREATKTTPHLYMANMVEGTVEAEMAMKWMTPHPLMRLGSVPDRSLKPFILHPAVQVRSIVVHTRSRPR